MLFYLSTNPSLEKQKHGKASSRKGFANGSIESGHTNRNASCLAASIGSVFQLSAIGGERERERDAQSQRKNAGFCGACEIAKACKRAGKRLFLQDRNFEQPLAPTCWLRKISSCWHF